MTDAPTAKAQLRKSILGKRDQLGAEQRIENSICACDHALHIDAFSADKFSPGTVVAGFNPIRSEIDPRPLMFALAKLGARLCLPVIMDKQTIIFRELLREATLVETGFGTFGPDENANTLDPQILLVPLSVFDKKGGRIGYGAGFYDRAIEKLEAKGIKPLLVGIAFSIQEADDVPMESHDRRLNGIVTENGYIAAQ